MSASSVPIPIREWNEQSWMLIASRFWAIFPMPTFGVHYQTRASFEGCWAHNCNYKQNREIFSSRHFVCSFEATPSEQWSCLSRSFSSIRTIQMNCWFHFRNLCTRLRLFLTAGDKRRFNFGISRICLAGSIPSANLQHLTSEHTRNDNNIFRRFKFDRQQRNAKCHKFWICLEQAIRFQDVEIMLNIYRYSNTPIGINNISQNDATFNAKNNIWCRPFPLNLWYCFHSSGILHLSGVHHNSWRFN